MVYQGGNGLSCKRELMQMAACPFVQRCRVHHFSTSNPPGSLTVCKKKFLISKTKFLSLFSDVLEATQDSMGSSPSQSQSSAVLLSLLCSSRCCCCPSCLHTACPLCGLGSCPIFMITVRSQPWGAVGFLCLPWTVHPQRGRSGFQIVSI